MLYGRRGDGWGEAEREREREGSESWRKGGGETEGRGQRGGGAITTGSSQPSIPLSSQMALSQNPPVEDTHTCTDTHTRTHTETHTCTDTCTHRYTRIHPKTTLCMVSGTQLNTD